MNKQQLTATTLALTAAASVSFVQAVPENVFIQTDEFGSREFHEVPNLGEVATAGLIVGYIIFGFVIIVSMILIIRDMVVRHQEYLRKINDARKRMRELGISVEEADREFEQIQRGYKAEDDDDRLINAAENQSEQKKA